MYVNMKKKAKRDIYVRIEIKICFVHVFGQWNLMVKIKNKNTTSKLAST